MGIRNMASPLTLRLDAKTRKQIERIARRRQVSVSEVIRLAIAAWAEQQEPIAAPYDAIADLIGVVHGGMPGRSTQTGRRFSEVLKKRRNHKKWAAYHGDERVAIARSQVDAYQECFRRGLKRGEFYVGWLRANPDGIPPWGPFEGDRSLYEFTELGEPPLDDE